MIGFIYKTFLKGLAAVLPMAITLYIFYWLGTTFENLLGGLVKLFVPKQWYVPGAGVALGLFLIFAVGILFHMYVIRRFWQFWESWFNRLPLVKSIYGGVKDVMDFVSGSGADQAKKVVMVKFGEGDRRVMGMVTREAFDDVPDVVGTDGMIAVYLPMSYQIGGFTLMLPREQVEEVDMSVEDAMRFAFTAGMTQQRSKASSESDKRSASGSPDESSGQHNEASATNA
jgi:uncharacterized membrane protein